MLMDSLSRVFKGRVMGMENMDDENDSISINTDEYKSVGNRDPNRLTGMFGNGQGFDKMLSMGGNNINGQGFDKMLNVNHGNNKSKSVDNFFQIAKGKNNVDSFFKTTKTKTPKFNMGNMLSMGNKNKNFYGFSSPKSIIKNNPMEKINMFLGGGSKSKNNFNMNGMFGIEQNARKGMVMQTDKLGMWRMKQQQGLPLFGDFDMDNVLNIFDCQPRNKKMQGPLEDSQDISEFTGGAAQSPYVQYASQSPDVSFTDSTNEENVESPDSGDITLKTGLFQSPTMDVTYNEPILSTPNDKSSGVGFTSELNLGNNSVYVPLNETGVVTPSPTDKIRKWFGQPTSDELEKIRQARVAGKTAGIQAAAELKAKAAGLKEYQKYVPQKKAGTKKKVEWAVGPDGKLMPVVTPSVSSSPTGFWGQTKNEAQQFLSGVSAAVSPMASGQRFSELALGGGATNGGYRMTSDVGRTGGFYKMAGGPSFALPGLYEMVGKEPPQHNLTGKARDIMGFGDSTPLVAPSANIYVPPVEVAPAEPVAVQPQRISQASSDLKWSPISRRYVRYPRGPYKKVQYKQQ
jgi:hypothetical protein